MLVPPPTPKKNTRIVKFKVPLAFHLAILQFQDPLGTIATNVQTTEFFAQQLHLNLAINPKSLSSPRRNGHFHHGPERSGPRFHLWCVFL